MAKRHGSLIDLSHDHHHGLALALRLKQGDNALLSDGWTHDRVEQARRVGRFYRVELQPHFAAEERALFPAMRQHASVSTPLIDELVAQHRTLEESIERIALAEASEVGLELVRLGKLLEQHIRAEERELFPIFEEHFPTDLAVQVGEEIKQVHEEAVSTLRSFIHVREETVINAKTDSIYAALEHVASYPSWWEDASMPDDEDPEGGESVLVRLGEQTLRCRLCERQKPKLVRLHVTCEGHQGEASFSVEDAPGGRRVLFEITIDPVTTSSGEGSRPELLERQLSDSVRLALEALKRSLS